MVQELILEPRQKIDAKNKQTPKNLLKIDAKEKQILKSLLTQEQIIDFQCGKVVATCGGVKLGLEDEIKGTVFILTPLQAG